MKISYELIPNSLENIEREVKWLKNKKFNLINIPDIQKFKIRSWEIDLNENDFRNKSTTIYHIRAIDFDIIDIDKIEELISTYKLRKILVIKGDCTDRNKKVYNTTVIDLIKIIKSIDTSIEVYAAFDPYRQSIGSEINSMNKKLSAGADYLISQPFFDINLIKTYCNLFDSSKLYFGISPVVSETSKNYWNNVNKVVFPIGFKPTYDWNINFANKALDTIELLGANAYFMPIKIDLDKYFGSIELE